MAHQGPHLIDSQVSPVTKPLILLGITPMGTLWVVLWVAFGVN